MKVIRIKADDGSDQWELNVLGLPYGGAYDGKDLQGEYFSHQTKFHEDKFPLPPVVYFHGNESPGNTKASPEYIGQVTEYEDKPDGRWYRVTLDKANDYAQRVWESAKKGLARASTGTVAHLYRAAKDGHILEWPVAELSLLDDGLIPINSYAVALPVLKAHCDNIPSLKAFLPESDPKVASVKATVKETLPSTDTKIGDTMTDKKEKVEDVETTPAFTLDDIKAAFKAEIDPIADRVKAIEEEPKNELPVAQKAVNIITDTDNWKYDNYPTQELAMTMNIIKSGTRRPASTRFQKAFFSRLESDEAKKNEGLKAASNQARRLGIKANETNFSTNASFGDEWVGVAYSGDLWEKARVNSFVMEQLTAANGNRTAPPGAESITFPLEGDDPVWYTVAQAGDPGSSTAQVTNTVPAKALGTGNVSASLAKSGTSVIYTGEMVEDAVLDFVGTLQSRITLSAAEIMEAIAINGDTDGSATTNINDIGGTPAAGDWFMAVNGFRKSPLITTTANSRDGGVLASADFIETVKLMGNAGIVGLDPKKIAFILDPYTHFKAIQLADVKSLDVFTGATIESGRLASIFGTPVHVSGQMHKGATNLLANTSGLVDIDTQGNNTTGSILAVRWDHWRFGYRRDMTMEVERIPRADAWEITALMRYYLGQRDTEASAISYNLTI